MPLIDEGKKAPAFTRTYEVICTRDAGPALADRVELCCSSSRCVARFENKEWHPAIDQRLWVVIDVSACDLVISPSLATDRRG